MSIPGGCGGGISGPGGTGRPGSGWGGRGRSGFGPWLRRSATMMLVHHFGCTLGLPPGVPGGGITGIRPAFGSGARARMSGSTPRGGRITPSVGAGKAGLTRSGGTGLADVGGPGDTLGGMPVCANAAWTSNPGENITPRTISVVRLSLAINRCRHTSKNLPPFFRHVSDMVRLTVQVPWLFQYRGTAGTARR